MPVADAQRELEALKGKLVFARNNFQYGNASQEAELDALEQEYLRKLFALDPAKAKEFLKQKKSDLELISKMDRTPRNIAETEKAEKKYARLRAAYETALAAYVAAANVAHSSTRGRKRSRSSSRSRKTAGKRRRSASAASKSRSPSSSSKRRSSSAGAKKTQWNMFRKRNAGKGLTMKQMSALYRRK